MIELTRRGVRCWLRLGLGLCFAALVSCHKTSPPGADVWAQVDGKPIYRDQVERYYRGRTAPGSDPVSPGQALSLKLNILAELINNHILIDHASHSQVTVSEAEVDKRVEQLQSPYSKEEFSKRLNDQGLNVAELRDELRQSLIIEKLINKEIVSRVSVSDADIAGYYQRNRSNFDVPETQFHLAQIAVTPGPDRDLRNTKNDNAKTPADAERKIQALYAQLRAGGDFAALAANYSEDAKTSSGGGDMGFIPASALKNSPIGPAIASLQVGQFTAPIRGPDGYHIIKLLGREEPGQHPLSDPQVQAAIRRTLQNEKTELLKAAYIEDLRNRSKVINYLAQRIVAEGPDASIK